MSVSGTEELDHVCFCSHSGFHIVVSADVFCLVVEQGNIDTDHVCFRSHAMGSVVNNASLVVSRVREFCPVPVQLGCLLWKVDGNAPSDGPVHGMMPISVLKEL